MSEIRLTNANNLEIELTKQKARFMDKAKRTRIESDRMMYLNTATGLIHAINILHNAQTVEITEKQAILLLINNGWLVNHDKELREKWERPQGEWAIQRLQNGFDDVYCPFCNARPTRSEYGYYLLDNFCHECGADMRGAE